MFICIHQDKYGGTSYGEGDTLDEAFDDCENASGETLDPEGCKFYSVSEPLVIKRTIHEVPLG